MYVPEYDSLFFVVWSLAWSKARVAGGSRARVVMGQLITEEQFQDQDCFVKLSKSLRISKLSHSDVCLMMIKTRGIRL